MLALKIPPEGQNGFSRNWYPLCLSSDVEHHNVVGRDFLDGRVVAFRDREGTAHVTTAYCPHLGADLSGGDLTEEGLRCPFHHWVFDGSGTCVRTGCDDSPPPKARLFAYPAAERYGVLWVFNGDSPDYDLPQFTRAADQLVCRAIEFDEVFPVDPWVVMANTPDLQHLKAVHGFVFDDRDPDPDDFAWDERSFRYFLKGRLPSGDRIDAEVGIVGTNVFRQQGLFRDRWFGFLMAFTIPRRGTTSSFMIFFADPADDATTGIGAGSFIDSLLDMETHVIDGDRAILRNVHFQVGTMTRTDRALIRFLHFVRDYPRDHPAHGFDQ
ncbi:Rieske (2Fe-2S) protein [Amycolatopsis rubida]|uniref:Rieske (2Fe-2S) protein n=3 Tax=Amycolatopsis TaxID=1813 RepID=A0ABX0BTV0_9PSEU|nr:Rieske 2Fe-2S domain-containing protein [Amycolatopsis rubida]NEC58801.1 Rieske (2Fe-2S) protein [Amycolatopsis rubida]